MQKASQAASAVCKQATAATAVAASIEEDDVICISESNSEAVETSMDVDGGDSADQERKADTFQLPKRRVKAPQRFTPVKAKSGKRHFTYYENPYKKSSIKPAPSTHKKPAGSRRSKPSAFAPLSVTPAPATPAADVPAAAAAAAEAPDGVAVALGLQVATQYSQLLQQVQALLDNLHPSQEYTESQQLLEELTSLAEHRKQLQQLDGSLLGLMSSILQQLPRNMQKQARLMLLPYSSTKQVNNTPAAATGVANGSAAAAARME